MFEIKMLQTTGEAKLSAKLNEQNEKKEKINWMLCHTEGHTDGLRFNSEKIVAKMSERKHKTRKEIVQQSDFCVNAKDYFAIIYWMYYVVCRFIFGYFGETFTF